jgi:hypothetical protein
MYIDDDYAKLKMIIILAITACVICLLFSGCNSFKPIQLPGETSECNDFYTVLQYYSEVGKDSAFVGTVYNECKNSRDNKKQEKIESLCNLLHGDNIKEYQACTK